jgi:hypothetical protein
MIPALVAEFDDADRFIAALKAARAAGLTPFDAMAPFDVPEMAGLVSGGAALVRAIMAGAGFGVAIFAYALQWYSAVVAYPINSGGRPLDSWPVFLLAPFEVGILAAAVAGFIALLVGSGLPRLHHPLFDYPGVERATQDRFFLVVARVDDATEERARRLFFDAGALAVGAGET